MCQNAIFLILGGRRSRKDTLFHVKKCVHLHFSGGPGAHRLSRNLSFPWGKQYFLRKSGISWKSGPRRTRRSENHDFGSPPPGGLAFLSDGGGSQGEFLNVGVGGGGYGSPSPFPPFLLLTLLHLSIHPTPLIRVNSDSDTTHSVCCVT